MKRVLVIAHEPDCGAAQIGVRLDQRGLDVDTHVVTPVIDRPNEATPWPDFTAYDAIVPMGSIRNLPRKTEISAWIHDELDLLRQAHEKGRPILGICFGGQLLAEALGGRVEEAPVTEVGWVEIRPVAGNENPIGPGPWFQWHHDRFFPPPGAETLAESDHAAQLFRLGRTVGTQFHPEIDPSHLNVWLNACDDDYLETIGHTRQGLVEAMKANDERNTRQCHALVDWWLDEVAVSTTAAIQ